MGLVGEDFSSNGEGFTYDLMEAGNSFMGVNSGASGENAGVLNSVASLGLTEMGQITRPRANGPIIIREPVEISLERANLGDAKMGLGGNKDPKGKRPVEEVGMILILLIAPGLISLGLLNVVGRLKAGRLGLWVVRTGLVWGQ